MANQNIKNDDNIIKIMEENDDPLNKLEYIINKGVRINKNQINQEFCDTIKRGMKYDYDFLIYLVDTLNQLMEKEMSVDDKLLNETIDVVNMIYDFINKMIKIFPKSILFEIDYGNFTIFDFKDKVLQLYATLEKMEKNIYKTEIIKNCKTNLKLLENLLNNDENNDENYDESDDENKFLYKTCESKGIMEKIHKAIIEIEYENEVEKVFLDEKKENFLGYRINIDDYQQFNLTIQSIKNNDKKSNDIYKYFIKFSSDKEGSSLFPDFIDKIIDELRVNGFKIR
jgi:hypothetical protein